MGKVQLFWDPKGLELDSIGKTKLVRITDGDTPYISMSIRMLSIDTPEVHYPGNTRPSKHNAKLKNLADWIDAGKAPISDGLAAYLRPKLVTGNAGSLHEAQGKTATDAFQQLLDQKLNKPNGRKRSLFVQAADEHFDSYGRLLAYVSPSYSTNELATMSYEEKASFNFLMVASGWAALFPIFPSIPKYRDLIRFQKAAQEAFDDKKGAWADDKTLTGYEFRMCYKLWDVTNKLEHGRKVSSHDRYGWVERYCCDMTTREIVEPQDYYKIPPYNRIFIWPKDVSVAVGKLNLLPG